MILIRRVVVVSALTVPALAACGGSDRSASVAGESGDPPLLATTSVWADITSQVACGEPVTALIPAGADPHTFEPSLRDRELVEAAAVVIANGQHLEGSLNDLLMTVAAEGVNVVEIAPHVDLLPIGSSHDEEHDEEHDETADNGHGHDIEGDPHFWQDPTRVAGALDVIASAVVSAGGDADAIAACTATYHDELLALDAAITDLLAALPDQRRVLVTSHDSLAYFADRYDLEVVGTVIPATNTLAETNAADLAALERTIAERNVPAIFTEQLDSSSDANSLAERLGVRIVPLVTDALTDQPPGDSYTGMLRSNANLIAESLAP